MSFPQDGDRFLFKHSDALPLGTGSVRCMRTDSSIPALREQKAPVKHLGTIGGSLPLMFTLFCLTD